MRGELTNQFKAVFAGSTSVRIVASDGTLHADLAAVVAAGKRPYGQIDGSESQFIQDLILTHDNASGADGAGVLISINREDTPSGQADFEYYLNRYAPLHIEGPIRQLWVKFTTATDVLRCAGRG